MSAPRNPGDGGQYSSPGDYGQYQPPAGHEQSLTRPRNGFGIAALLLGLLALVTSWTIVGGIVLGILALVFGLLGRARAKRGQATNGGLSVAGAVLGVIGTLIAIGIIAFGVSVINSPAGRDYQQCIERSAGDPAKVQQCTAEFSRQIGAG